ncbi:MAG: hypothetical protein K6E29_02755 [Cyanobacteria bacterium RUI128]|nr:hypothetical protein [Cyanobacteria bacterium RUI128]
MARRKKFDIVSVICILIGVLCAFIFAQQPPSQNTAHKASYKSVPMKEGDYVNMYCKGIIEYQLPDRTRVDCLTDEYAIEYDWAKKWAESIGQAMYYSKMTGKKPAVAIIIRDPYERIYIERIKKANPDIKIFEIKSIDYVE